MFNITRQAYLWKINLKTTVLGDFGERKIQTWSTRVLQFYELVWERTLVANIALSAYSCGTRHSASASACFEAGTPIRGSRVWRGCGIGISVKYDVTATGRCTQPSVPLPLLSHRGSPLLSAYRDFSQADSSLSVRRDARIMLLRGAREAASAEQDWRCGRINKTLTMRARTAACRQNCAEYL